MAYKHLIFDLDGTLLDTIEDICFAINKALAEKGYPWSYDRESCKALVGDGADALLHRALREYGQDMDRFNDLKALYMVYYKKHQTERAKPFEGMKETLDALKAKGMTFSCVTNKPDNLAHIILDMHFGAGYFEFIYGANGGTPVKPDPKVTVSVIEDLGLEKQDCLYVGDSHVDIDTGHNAGLGVALCLWGYEVDYGPLLDRAEYYLHAPSDLLNFLE